MTKHRLIGVVGLAFVVRAALPLAALAVTWPQGPLIHEPDSAGYVRLAEELVETGRFTVDGRPEIERTPGYVCLLIPGVLSDHIDAVTIALQCIVGSLTVFLTFHLALVVFERASAALAGAIACACEPLSVLYAGKLLSETTFTCAVAAVLLFLARYLRRGGWRDLVVSAVVLAAAIYVRPIALYLPGVLGVSIVVGRWRQCPSRLRLLGQAAAFIGLAAGPPVAWIARNEMVAGYGRFSAMGDVNLYFWNAAGVEAARQGQPLADVQRAWGYFSNEIFFERHPGARGWMAAQRYGFYRVEARRILSEAPGTTLAVYLDGIRGTLIDPGTQAFRDYFREKQTPVAQLAKGPTGAWARLRHALATRPLVVALHFLLHVVVLGFPALALVGCLTQGNWRRLPVAILLVTLAYFLLLSGGPAGYHRFRLPLVPIVSVLAGAGWTALWNWRSN
ncbi:MAG TPA: glycosyltransferase family 39 protein [Pirellulales bacterium]|nr:glycosyltransferase family 39 protein [Pirellulales bacterium]